MTRVRWGNVALALAALIAVALAVLLPGEQNQRSVPLEQPIIAPTPAIGPTVDAAAAPRAGSAQRRRTGRAGADRRASRWSKRNRRPAGRSRQKRHASPRNSGSPRTVPAENQPPGPPAPTKPTVSGAAEREFGL